MCNTLLGSGLEVGVRWKGNLLPGIQLQPSSVLQPERGRFLHFHSVTFWVGNAKQVERLEGAEGKPEGLLKGAGPSWIWDWLVRGVDPC